MRVDTTAWLDRERWLLYLLITVCSATTPISIAVSLGVLQSFQPASHIALLVSSIFDSTSPTINLYLVLAQLISHDFFLSSRTHGSKYLKDDGSFWVGASENGIHGFAEDSELNGQHAGWLFICGVNHDVKDGVYVRCSKDFKISCVGLISR